MAVNHKSQGAEHGHCRLPVSHNTFKSWSESIEEQVPDEFLDEFTEFVLGTIFSESLEKQHDIIEEGK